MYIGPKIFLGLYVTNPDVDKDIQLKKGLENKEVSNKSDKQTDIIDKTKESEISVVHHTTPSKKRPLELEKPSEGHSYLNKKRDEVQKNIKRMKANETKENPIIIEDTPPSQIRSNSNQDNEVNTINPTDLFLYNPQDLNREIPEEINQSISPQNLNWEMAESSPNLNEEMAESSPNLNEEIPEETNQSKPLSLDDRAIWEKRKQLGNENYHVDPKLILTSKPRYPRIIDADLLSNFPLDLVHYNDANIFILEPWPRVKQEGYTRKDLKWLPPHLLFPGSYSNEMGWGTSIPILPSLKMNPTMMSTDQLNHVISYIAYSGILHDNKEEYLKEYPELEAMYEDLHTYCDWVKEEILLRNYVFEKCEKDEELTDEEIIISTKAYYGEFAWKRYKEQCAKSLYKNYKLYRQNKIKWEWKYNKESDQSYLYKNMDEIKKQGLPLCKSVPASAGEFRRAIY